MKAIFLGLPKWLRGKESACQCRRCRKLMFNLWVRKTPWRRKWQPIPIFLPGESHEQRSLVGYSPWGNSQIGLSIWACTHKCCWGWEIKVEKKEGRAEKARERKAGTRLWRAVCALKRLFLAWKLERNQPFPRLVAHGLGAFENCSVPDPHLQKFCFNWSWMGPCDSNI